jgi:hypothetical protein
MDLPNHNGLNTPRLQASWMVDALLDWVARHPHLSPA